MATVREPALVRGSLPDSPDPVFGGATLLDDRLQALLGAGVAPGIRTLEEQLVAEETRADVPVGVRRRA